MAEMGKMQDMWLHQLTICRDMSNAKVSHDLGMDFNDYTVCNDPHISGLYEVCEGEIKF